MKYVSEFRDPSLAKSLLSRIHDLADQLDGPVRIMEVCGTHSMTVMRYGLREALPDNVYLVSGPGCPVCVTPDAYVDVACAYASEGFLVTSFGDMLRVPGTESSLVAEKSKGAEIRIVYSPLDALGVAKDHPDREIVFLAVGFETTAPAVAATLMQAKEQQQKNFTALVAHKLIPPAMKLLVDDAKIQVHGFLCPGHVSVIIGAHAYQMLADEYGIPCVVAGFEPLDVLEGVRRILRQLVSGVSKVENAYERAVTVQGNQRAQATAEKVFAVADSAWRGLGVVSGSGLSTRPEYASWDTSLRHPKTVQLPPRDTGCRCGDVLRGVVDPPECALFASHCTPVRPVGPCMVSSEGACNIHYRFSSLNNR